MGNRKIMSIIIALLIVIVLSSTYLFVFIYNSYNPNDASGNTIRVIDGDTFEYNGEVIRLLCIDTPELGSEGYAEASIFLSNLAYDNEMRIDRRGFDDYNRTLAYVYVNDLLINKEIVDEGYGTLFVYGDESCEGMK